MTSGRVQSGQSQRRTNPEHPVASPELGVLGRSQADGVLLTQGRVLECQGGARHQGSHQADE